jgi:lipopolysaccharide heptosyltransferase I
VRILLVRLSALGDVVTGLHVLSTLKARFCSAHIGWLVEDRFASLLKDHPQIDSVHVYERKRVRLPWNWWRIPGFVRRLRRERYDIALDLQGNLKSGVLARLAGAGRCVGLDRPLSREGNHLLIRERVPPPDGHRVDAYHRLVDEVLGSGVTAPAILPAEPERHEGVVLHPGTSGFGAFKRWPLASYAALGDRLATAGAGPILLTAGPGERPQADEVRRQMKNGARLVEPAGLPALRDVLAGARLVVAGDTGPAHVAAALGVPTVVLFGPKDPRVLAPVGPRVRTVRTGVRCSPCTLRFCPAPVCMTEMSVDLVAECALEMLAEAG